MTHGKQRDASGDKRQYEQADEGYEQERKRHTDGKPSGEPADGAIHLARCTRRLGDRCPVICHSPAPRKSFPGPQTAMPRTHGTYSNAIPALWEEATALILSCRPSTP